MRRALPAYRDTVDLLERTRGRDVRVSTNLHKLAHGTARFTRAAQQQLPSGDRQGGVRDMEVVTSLSRDY